jgi:hypothetical protein
MLDFCQIAFSLCGLPFVIQMLCFIVFVSLASPQTKNSMAKMKKKPKNEMKKKPKQSQFTTLLVILNSSQNLLHMG